MNDCHSQEYRTPLIDLLSKIQMKNKRKFIHSKLRSLGFEVTINNNEYSFYRNKKLDKSFIYFGSSKKWVSKDISFSTSKQFIKYLQRIEELIPFW